MKAQLAIAVLASWGLHRLEIPTCGLLPAPPEFEAVEQFLRTQGDAMRVPEPETGGAWVLGPQAGEAMARGAGAVTEEILVTFEARHEPPIREAKAFVQVTFRVEEAGGEWRVRGFQINRDPAFPEFKLDASVCPRHRFVAVQRDSRCPLER